MFKHYPRCLPLLLGFVLCSGQAAGQADFSLQAEGFDSHVELNWQPPPGTTPASYRLYHSLDGTTFTPVKTVSQTSTLDFTGFPGSTPATWYYKAAALNGISVEIATSDTVQVTVAEMSDTALLSMVQRYTFRYFWDFAHPVSRMARERNTSGDIVTTGGTGFGVMAIVVAVHRGWITREQGRDRLLELVSFLQFADRFHGVFPHWMNGNTGNAIPFSQFDDGGDLVETAFLMQGLLAARSFFNENTPFESALRDAITGLWEDVEWDFYTKNNSGVLYWHWSPNYAWQMDFPLRGFNETMIVYILAIASPTYPVPASYWNTGWTSQNYFNGLSWYGYPLATGPPLGGPLFFAHYSFLGFDPRNKKDFFANYFSRNKNHTLINRAYCIDNPENHMGYSEVSWGLTASDDPWGYLAHEPRPWADNGTITPTAALSSMPYTPAESITALKHFYREHGEQLWGEMGFYDAFNLDENWFATSYLAIDQGPIVGMIENYRSGLLWEQFMANPEIQPALDAIGFVPDATGSAEVHRDLAWSVSPNPATEAIGLQFYFVKKQNMTLDLLDAQGRQIRQIFENKNFPSRAGAASVTVPVGDLPRGVYFFRLGNGAQTSVRKIVKQ
jgi:hypothetical protein